MCVRRTDKMDVTHVVPLDVVEEEARALDQALVLLARDVLADEPGLGLSLLDNERAGGNRCLGHADVSAAALIASKTFQYPVHRQRFPCSALRMSASLGLGFFSNSAVALIS